MSPFLKFKVPVFDTSGFSHYTAALKRMKCGAKIVRPAVGLSFLDMLWDFYSGLKKMKCGAKLLDPRCGTLKILRPIYSCHKKNKVWS
jgi:hypothetical protein